MENQPENIRIQTAEDDAVELVCEDEPTKDSGAQQIEYDAVEIPMKRTTEEIKCVSRLS